MKHLSNQFFEQFLKSIQKDENIPSDFKTKIVSMYSEKNLSKGDHLKKLLNDFEYQQQPKNENSEN